MAHEDGTLSSVDGFDIIGDIHGYSDKLHGLLTAMGYERSSGTYRHESRTTIFVGDLIDRGDSQTDVLSTVKDMVDAGSAQIVMGNHEFNAITYATEHPEQTGLHLREHNDKNKAQHEEFLGQIEDAERSYWIEWFKTFPLWLDLDEGLRVVHACWNDASISLVRQAKTDTGLDRDAFFVDAASNDNALYEAVEVLLKGPEMNLKKYDLPKFLDKGGHPRSHARIRWWNTVGTSVRDLAEIQPGAMKKDGSPYPEIDAVPCDESELAFAYQGSKPVIFGHYWRQWPPTVDLDWTSKAACADFSAGKGGPLVAYRWSGEAELSEDNVVCFPDLREGANQLNDLR